MGWIKQVAVDPMKDHDCKVPKRRGVIAQFLWNEFDIKGTPRFDYGSIWRCDVCKTVYRYEEQLNDNGKVTYIGWQELTAGQAFEYLFDEKPGAQLATEHCLPIDASGSHYLTPPVIQKPLRDAENTVPLPRLDPDAYPVGSDERAALELAIAEGRAERFVDDHRMPKPRRTGLM